MGSSLGYSSEEEDIKMLKNVHSVAKASCELIMETENRDHTLKHFSQYLNYDFETLLIRVEWKFDFESSTSIGKCKYFQKHSDGKLNLVFDLITTLRLYSLHELRKILSEAGWTYLGCYGIIMAIDKRDLGSADIITVSVKK